MPKKRAFEVMPLSFEILVALEQLGGRIAAARKARRLSQRALADMLGIAPATLVALEHGQPTVQVGHYARAAWMLELGHAEIGDFGVSGRLE